MGRRGDAIIRKCSAGVRFEFGGSEVGSYYKGQNSTKWLNESGLKLPKMKRDMFISLCKSTNWDLEKINNMETVGYIHGGKLLQFPYYYLNNVYNLVYFVGSVLMIMTLDLPAGYINRLSKSELFRIPEDIESFNKVIELITAVWKSKVTFTLFYFIK